MDDETSAAGGIRDGRGSGGGGGDGAKGKFNADHGPWLCWRRAAAALAPVVLTAMAAADQNLGWRVLPFPPDE